MMKYTNSDLHFDSEIPVGKVGWQSPSNIALVKYWGKKPVQIPRNPSVSFTLSQAVTKTKLHFSPAQGKEMKLRFSFEGKQNATFEKKTAIFFKSLLPLFPFIGQLDFEIFSENSFPHSAGIASSASGMSALALCLCTIEKEYFSTFTDADSFLKKASFVARLGSGSACRSLYGGCAIWGETTAMENTSDLYGIPFNALHPVFQTYRDTILIVDAGAKKVSSRAGHSLMETNPFATARFGQAKQHLTMLLKALQTGDTETFIRITESEALTLHAMMMTSQPYYMLLKAASVVIIEKVFAFRKRSGLPLSFTLDAGPNIHLLYPENIEKEVTIFLQEELPEWVKQGAIIYDKVGNGPERMML